MNVQAGSRAGQVRVLITNEGVHSAEKWARETASMVIAIDDAIAPNKLADAVKLRDFLVDSLRAVFHEVRADSTMVELQRIARQVRAALVDKAKGTPWQVDFEGLGDMIELTIWRNLHTAADIAVQTE